MIDIKEVTDGRRDGERVWICDFRQPDLNKKPVRAVPPTHVEICSNETAKRRINYSHSHFRPISKAGKTLSKIIVPYDTTGFRTFPGIPLKVFAFEDDCVKYFNDQVMKVYEVWRGRKETAVKDIEREMDALLDMRRPAE